MNSKQKKGVGERIKFIRKEILEKNQIEMIKVLKMSQAMLSKLERGVSYPSIDTLIILKKKSGKSIDWILTGND